MVKKSRSLFKFNATRGFGFTNMSNRGGVVGEGGKGGESRTETTGKHILILSTVYNIINKRGSRAGLPMTVQF